MTAQITILDELGARIENVRLTNGYDFDLESAAIKRAQLTPFKTGDLPAVNYWVSAPDVLTVKTGRRETRELSISIEVYDTTRDEPFVDVAVRLSENIVTALFRDTSAPLVSSPLSYALGGLVENITVDSVSPVIVEGEGSWCGALIECTVTYNIVAGDFSTIVKY